MVLTNNIEYHDKLQLFRTHGIIRDSKKLIKNEGGWYYEMQDLGYNYRITDFQCALGISQFKKLDKFVKRRREIAARYNKGLKDLGEIITPFEKKDVKSSYHLYMIQLRLEKLSADRKKIFDALRAENIGVHVHYIPLHHQPYYRKHFNYKNSDYPVAEEFYNRNLTVPIFPKMTNDDVDDVIDALFKVIKFYRRK